MLIATVLSQNTNDRNSFKAYQNLKFAFKEWKFAIHSSEAEIEELIKIAGLKKQKCKTIKTILSYLENDADFLSVHQMDNLSNKEIFDMLIKIKGIGIKTISCLLLFSLKRNICPVDTHVHRILNKVGIVNTTTPDVTFTMINNSLPENIAHSLHTNLIKLGREICKPTNPGCKSCPLNGICKYKSKVKNKNIKLKLNEFMLLDNI